MENVVKWLLEDDEPALRLQVNRDLLGRPEAELGGLRAALPRRGWCRELLERRGADGHWGNGAYNPKWTCTHYVLHELMQLGLGAGNEACAESTRLLLAHPRGVDGGINYAKTVEYSDVCINGMLLAIAATFIRDPACTDSLVDYLLRMQLADGGWNCMYYQGDTRSSLHTTVAVLEGLFLRASNPGAVAAGRLRNAASGGVEFILRHRLYRSERTGEIIKDDFFKFPFPVRWKYDILRCLDLFRRFGVAHDGRMDEALDRIEAARDRHGRWKSRSQAGKTYSVREKNGSPGRWNTLRALRVLRAYRPG